MWYEMGSGKVAIQVRGLGKKYSIGGPHEKYLTLRDAIVNSVKTPFHRILSRETPQEFWALKDVSFDVEQGEVVGIIGRNGAGKSTLLKILSRITSPTEGTVDLYGRVGSLLEVGTGFHPELTGRENIFLSGSILGMKKREIEDKLDDIVKFSEIEQFLDTPAKRYSSGMYVRLAFAVAAHLEPEILLVDEVLAVGDAAFQKKCLGKMGEIAKEGRTVLFVSHQMDMVRTLCERGIWIDNGQIRSNSLIEETINAYLASVKATGSGHYFIKNPDPDLPLQITSVIIRDSEGKEKTRYDVFEKIIIELTFTVRNRLTGSIVKVELRKNNSPIFWSFDTDDYEQFLEARDPGDYKSFIEIPSGILKPGIYSVSCGTGIANSQVIEDLEGCLSFEVVLLSKSSTFLSYAEKRPGIVVSPVRWDTQKIHSA